MKRLVRTGMLATMAALTLGVVVEGRAAMSAQPETPRVRPAAAPKSGASVGERASIVLLGTALLGCMGAVRRKLT